MLKKIGLISVMLLMVTFTGCSMGAKPPMGEIEYDTIDTFSTEFAKINQGDLKIWYEQNYNNEGVYTFTQDENLYILIAAGEKPTAGYSLKNITLTGQENEIVVTAELATPDPQELVAQVITAPHELVRIPADTRPVSLEAIEGNSESLLKTDSGTFLGQIDRNSIEVQISSVPDEVHPKAFQLSEELKQAIEGLKLQPGNQIKFKFYTPENRPSVIIELTKLN